MRKLLLLVAIVAASLTATAQTSVTIVIKDMMKEAYNITGNKTNFPEWEYLGFKFSTDKKDASQNPMYNKAGDWRVYGGSEMTVTAADGGQMTEIVFYISADGLRRWPELTPSTGACAIDMTDNTVTWTGSASAVTFTVGMDAVHGTQSDKAGIFQFEKVKLSVDSDLPFSSSPVISPVGARYADNVQVTITGADGATIYYTLDGTTPTQESTLYTKPFTLTESATVTAIAVEPGLAPSNAVSEKYEILPGVHITDLADFLGHYPNWSDPDTGGDVIFCFDGEYQVSYQNGRMLYVQDSTAGMLVAGRINYTYQEGDIITGFRGIFRSMNGCPQLVPVASSMSAPVRHDTYQWTPGAYADITNKMNVNRPYVLNNVRFALDTETESSFYGWIEFADGHKTALYNGFSSPSEFNPVVTLPADGQYDIYGLVSITTVDGVPQMQFLPVKFDIVELSSSPVISPVGARYVDNVQVTITGAEGATIYYTLDGTTPTQESTLYTEPFTLTESATVTAIAVEPGLAPSNAVSEKYEIVPVVHITDLTGLLGYYPDWSDPTIGDDVIFCFDGEYQVSYQNGRMLYVQDSTAGMLVAGRINYTYQEGDIITGFRGIFRPMNGCPQLEPVASSMSASVRHDMFQWTPGTYADIINKMNVNRAYVLNNVRFTLDTEAESSFYGWIEFADGQKAALYNGFSSASEFNPVVTLPADGQYDIYGLVSIATVNGAPQMQFLPVKFDIASGVESALETTGPVSIEYYHMDGTHASACDTGLLIEVRTLPDGSRHVTKRLR